MPKRNKSKNQGKNVRKPTRMQHDREQQHRDLLNESNCNFQNSDEDTNPFKHPKHLKGRAIGLFYRDLNRKRRESDSSQEGSINDEMRQQRKEQRQLNCVPHFMKPTFLPRIILSDSRKSYIQDLLRIELPASYNSFHDSNFKREFLERISVNLEDTLQSAIIPTEMPRNLSLDRKYLDDFIEKRTRDTVYRSMETARARLPVYNQKDGLVKMINDNQVVVISGETGCGKTTQVAQYILEDCLLNGRASQCRIICTQPRRISAITVAERVAQERNERLGQSVGYQIRLEKVLPRQYGSITYATTGVILTQMVSDPTLSTVSHLIIDEIHERDALSDFILTVAKIIIQRRESLKLILMSATLNAQKFSKYFNNCPHVNIQGFTYPVQEYYLEDVLNFTKFNFELGYGKEGRLAGILPKKPPRKNRSDTKKRKKDFAEMIEPHVRRLKSERLFPVAVCEQLRHPNSEDLNINLIFELVVHICKTQGEGAILVFLPGYSDISSLMTMFNKSGQFPAHRFALYGLHSQMPTIQQKEIFLRPRAGVRKIILATNIAETSITIDDVVFVVDCGYIKMTNYDSENNVQTLLPEWVSLANARQRRGRAGRVQAGVCYHLYSQARMMILEQYQKPEVLRTRLEETVLKIKMLQLGNAQSFLQRFMDPPSRPTVAVSVKFLQSLNALDLDENLTPLGYHLAKLPIHPQMGKMVLLGAVFGCLDPILSIAAGLGFKDPFQKPLGKEKEADRAKLELSDGLRSDHILLHQALTRYENMKRTNYSAARQFCWEYFMSSSILDQLLSMKQQFADYLFEMNFTGSNDHKAWQLNINSENVSLIKAIICGGLYPNLGHITSRLKKPNKRNFHFCPAVRTLDNMRAKVHPNSINEQQEFTSNTLLVYFTRIKSTALYLHDITLVQPLPILFFGPNTQKRRAPVIVKTATPNPPPKSKKQKKRDRKMAEALAAFSDPSKSDDELADVVIESEYTIFHVPSFPSEAEAPEGLVEKPADEVKIEPQDMEELSEAKASSDLTYSTADVIIESQDLKELSESQQTAAQDDVKKPQNMEEMFESKPEPQISAAGPSVQTEPAAEVKTESETMEEFECKELIIKSDPKSPSPSTAADDGEVASGSAALEGGGEVDDHDLTIIVVDNQISMRCDEGTADLILQLKDRLNLLLEYRVSHPTVVDWTAENIQTVTLKAIIELVTSEDFGVLMDDYEDFEDEDDDDSTFSDKF